MRSTILLFLLTVAVTAAPISLSVTMTPGQEIPPPTVVPPADPMGTADLMIDLDAATLSATLTWMDMTSPVTAAHIHRFTPPSLTGPPVVPFFMGMMFPETGTWSTPAGGISLTADQVTALRAGLMDGTLYVNIHTVVNAPGEIRSDLGAVPEPGTWLLLSAGLAGLAVWKRRRA